MITFDVDAVGVASSLLGSELSPIDSILRQLGEGGAKRLEAAASNVQYLRAKLSSEEDYDFDRAPSLEGAIHPLVEAIHLAYAEHYPLELSPDDVWLSIAQGFGHHVIENAEALRGRFVRHEGQKLITVRRDDFVRDSSANDWPGVFDEFGAKIADYIGKQRDLVVANFSTTGPIEKAASEIVLMSAMQKYFDYRLVTLCGIPRITLLGTPQDWQSVRTRAAVLSEYDLGWWVESLLPILDEFVAAANGKVNRAFWQSIYKIEGGSGGPFISGWVTVFFPYVMREGKPTNSRDEPPVVLVSNQRWLESRKRHPEDLTLTTDVFPPSFSMAPFIWEYLGVEIPMQFVGGFVGVSQHPETRAIRPAIGWAVREAPASSRRG